MSEQDMRSELSSGHIEPLLPIEKKLISWSLSISIVLLAGLIIANHFYPIPV